MANKRQKKKQQGKHFEKQLRSVGVPKKQVKSVKNKPVQATKILKQREKERKAEVRKTARNAEAARRSDLIRELGYKVSDYASKRYVSQSKWDTWYKEEVKKKKQREYQRKYREKKRKEKEELDTLSKGEPLYLLIFWRQKDRNDLIDGKELIADMKHRYKYMSNEWLIQSILGFMTTKEPYPAPIGTSHVTVIPESRRHDYIQFMQHFHENDTELESINDWNLVYDGKASTRQYHWLLLAIHTMIRLMYDASERADFVGNLIYQYLPKVNKDTAKRLAKDLKYRRK